MMRKVSVIGHFGFGENLLNGQTVKTKTITEELENEYGKDEIIRIDTHGGKRALLKLLFQIFSALYKTNNVIMFPAYNGLRVIAPVLSIGNRFFKRSLQYVVIGGWLPEFLLGKPRLIKTLKRFDGIYVETASMKQALMKFGFSNIYVMPNCKKLTIIEEMEDHDNSDKPLKLCTFSRVMKAKGIEDAVDVVKSINDELGYTAFSLDVYGQVDTDEVAWFEALKAGFPDYVKYGGLVPFENSAEVLKNYFALLFPTYYDGEGFAGTLIDAMAAGVPVIASDWKYNPEIICEGRTGLLYESKNNDKLKECILYAYNNQDKWNGMKKDCRVFAMKYSPQKAIKVLKENLR